MTTSIEVLDRIASHMRICFTCRAFFRPGGSETPRHELEKCPTYLRLHAEWRKWATTTA